MSETLQPLDLSACLRRIPLFSELGDEDLAGLLRQASTRTLSRGELLFQRGDTPRSLFCVLEGQIKLAVSSPQGQEKIVEVIAPNQSFGEAVLFLDRPYPVYAEALCDSLLLAIGREAILQRIDDTPGFARKLLAGLSIRLHGLIRDVETYALRSSTQRVIAYLLELAPSGEAPGRLLLPTSKQVIASRLSLTPETLSRILHELAEAGLIELAGRQITVCDPARLRAYGD